jgi:hypothetical protein
MEVEGADRSTARRACIPQQQQFGLGSDADGEESPCTEQLKNLGSRLQRCSATSDWPNPLARPLCAQSAPDTCSHMGLLDRPPRPSITSFALISPPWICSSLAPAAVLCPPRRALPRRALPPNPGPSCKPPSLNPNAAPPHL